MKTTKLPPFSKHHKGKHARWMKKFIKTDFLTAIFSDECRATVDESVPEIKVYLLHRDSQLIRLRI